MNEEKKFIKLTPFKMQVLQSFPFIDEDFDAITNYELLCKVVDYLNKTVENVDYLNDTVNDYIDKFNELKSYVDNYFDNLDVQEEINNKLDEMAESGELTDIIAQYLGLAGVLAFNTVADMKQATNLVNGSTAKTLGYHTINDGGGALYKIRNIENSDVVDEANIISIQNNLVAELNEKKLINPIMFGAYGDGIHDDHLALIKVIKFAFDNRISYNNNNYEACEINFLNKKYLNNSTIIFNADTTYANSININGNGSYIIGHGFKFTSNAGWKLNIKNLNMSEMTTAFEFETRNLEYGNFVFDNIEFVSVENPFIMDRQSCIVEIKNCIFRAVSSIGEFTNVDKLYFHHNWIEPINTITGVDYKSMLKQNVGNEGTMYIHDNLFVPVGGTNCKELCWIEVNKHARIYNNRFGGENTNYHPLRIGSGFVRAGEQIYTLHPYISFDHNDDVHGATSIILESLAGNMLFTENQGYIGGNKVLEWSDKVTPEQQATIISNNIQLLNLVVKNNVGTSFNRSGDGNFVASGYRPTIPTNLYGIINRGLFAIDEKGGENKAYIDYSSSVKTNATSHDIVIKGQPFNNINSTSVAGRFTNVNTFSILFWTGYGQTGTYICGETYGLITFDLSYSNGVYMLTPKLKLIGEEFGISVLINGETSIDVTTLYQQDSFTLTLNATENNKQLKILHAQVFRPRDELSCFV